MSNNGSRRRVNRVRTHAVGLLSVGCAVLIASACAATGVAGPSDIATVGSGTAAGTTTIGSAPVSNAGGSTSFERSTTGNPTSPAGSAAASGSTTAMSAHPATPTQTGTLAPPTIPMVSATPTSDPHPSSADIGTVQHPIRVTLTGQVVVDRAGHANACTDSDGLVAIVGEQPTPSCHLGVPIKGHIDLAKLDFTEHNSTHTWGNTHLTGSWDGATLTLESQRRLVPADTAAAMAADTLPDFDNAACPAPAAGWPVGGVQDDPGVDKIPAAIGPSFGALAMGYPNGFPTNVNGNNPSYSMDHTAQVVVVGVTGDLAIATTAIRKVFSGSLCVVHSANTAVAVQKQSAELTKILGNSWAHWGVTGWGMPERPLGTPWLDLDVIADSAAVRQLVARLGGPPVTVRPWIVPDN